MTLSIVATTSGSSIVPCPIPLLRSRDVPHAERWIAAGKLVRIRRGILVDAAAWSALPPWRRYLVRVHAELLIHPEAVLSFESSCALLGLPVFGDPRVVHVLDDSVASSRLIGGVRVHTTRDAREIVELDGIRLVGAVDTVVDVARARHHAIGLAVADAALRDDPALRAEVLVAANESRWDKRGRRHARWVTHRTSRVAETVLESVSRAVIEWLGFDDPELQRWFVTDGRRDRGDFWWEDTRVLGEADGDLKYDGSLKSGVTAIRDEKERDRRLLRHARRVAHWGWADVMRIDPVRHELRRAGLHLRHAEDSRELTLLRAALTPPRP